MMPIDFPPWQTVYDHFSKCNKRGVWEKCWDRLVGYRREQVGRAAEPNYSVMDAQSLKTVYAREEGAVLMRQKGQRTIVILSWTSRVIYCLSWCMPDHLSTTKSACEVLERTVYQWSSLKVFSADAGYSGTAATFCTEK